MASIMATSGARLMEHAAPAATTEWRAPTPQQQFRIQLTADHSGGSGGSGHGVGPGAYSPRDALRSPASPRASFGTAVRFATAGRSGGYISPRHQSDLLCTASPGPKYNTAPTAATYPRQPALGWGDRNEAMHRDKKATFLAMTDANDVGPAGQWRLGAPAGQRTAVAHCSAGRTGAVRGDGQRAELV
jgi:hypothetical protein